MQRFPERLIGRKVERDRLLNLVQKAAGGAGSICLISGEAGCGKTTLVETVLVELGGKVLTLKGRALPEWTAPFGMLESLLRSALENRGRRRLSPAVKALDRLSAISGSAERADPGAEDLVRMLIDAALEACGDSAAVLFFDDLQWADESSLELLPRLAMELSSKKVAILATCRDDELPRSHPARRIRARLRRLPRAEELVLKPLSSKETGAMAEGILGVAPSRKLQREIHQRTSGLPLFVEEFCRSLQSGNYLEETSAGLDLIAGISVPVPDSVRDAVNLQCQELTSEGLDALEAAAVLGAEFPIDLVVEMGVDDSAMDELFESRFLVETGGGKGGFRHSLTREAVLEEIPWSRRRRLHGKAGDLLKRRGINGKEGSVAEHYREAGRREEARIAFLRIAEAACGIHAYRDASNAFEQALGLWPEDALEEDRVGCMERLARCAQASGFPAESARAWRDVIESEALRKDPGRAAVAWRSLASVYELSGKETQAVEARESALKCFTKAEMFEEAARESLGLADILICKSQLSEGLAHAERAVKLARKSGSADLESQSLSETGLALAMQGKEKAARRRIESGLELAIQHNLKEAVAAAYTQLAYVHGYQGDYAGQRDSFGTAVSFCEKEGLEAEQASCLGCMAFVLFRMGDWKKSTEVCRELLESKTASDSSRLLASGGLGLVFSFRGQIKQARRYLESANDGIRRIRIVPLELIIRPALAYLDVLSGADAAAEMRFREFIRFWESTEDRFDGLFGLCLAATFFGKHRLMTDLGSCAGAIQKIALENRNPEALGSLSHVLGETALAEDRPEDAAEQFSLSREQFERVQARYDVARSEHRIGEAFLQAGANDAGIDHLRKSYGGAKALGARPLQEIVRARLKSVGAMAEEARDANAPERAAKAGLTRRQREVAALIAEGMTNKEVAQKLHLSPRTIDMHVSHLLDRLDCSTRSEAVRRLIDLGLLD